MQLLQARRRPAAGRPLLTALLSLATAAALVGPVSPASAAAPAPTPPVTTTPPVAGRVTATLDACHVAAGLLDRYATFAAEMVATQATAEMSLRLELYEHTPGVTGYHLVSGVPGFGVWETSAPGVGVFTYSQEVTSLTAPASFRVEVGYRWLGADHRVIKSARRTTVSCVEPPELADLVVGAVSISPGPAPGTSSYAVTIRNDGPAAAGAFDVALSVGDVSVPDQTVDGLAAGGRTAVDFTGVSCASGGTLDVAVVVPQGSVPETTKVDGSRTVVCS
jgi:CARDB